MRLLFPQTLSSFKFNYIYYRMVFFCCPLSLFPSLCLPSHISSSVLSARYSRLQLQAFVLSGLRRRPRISLRILSYGCDASVALHCRSVVKFHAKQCTGVQLMVIIIVLHLLAVQKSHQLHSPNEFAFRTIELAWDTRCCPMSIGQTASDIYLFGHDARSSVNNMKMYGPNRLLIVHS